MAGESTEDRIGRLQALRVAAELCASQDIEIGSEELGAAAHSKEPEAESGGAEPTIRFRNYVPRNDKLQGLKVSPLHILKFNDPVATIPLDTNGTEDPAVSIAPKKANWDLRRDVAKKLEKLERRTQRAIIELMQEEEKRRQAASAESEAEDERY